MSDEKVSYSIPYLAAVEYLKALGITDLDDECFLCPEGLVHIVARGGGDTHLVILDAKRKRGISAPPKASEAKLRRIAMAYLAEHPEVDSLMVDLIEGLIVSDARVEMNALIGAYHWER